MAKETLIRCDLCGEYVTKEKRARIAVRRDEDRPESAEYLDIGPECGERSIEDLIVLADDHRPEMADGNKA